MKILFAGNSMTLHPPKPEIGWYGNYGMAASCAENDYAHKLAALIEESGKKPECMIRSIVDFERNPESYDISEMKEMRDFSPDIIIIHIVENTPKDKLTEFGEAYKKLIRYFNPESKAEVFCVGSFWTNDTGDGYISAAASECGAHFISLLPLQENKYRAIGMFEHSGVAAHPSDSGMSTMADMIFDEILKSGVLDKLSV